MIIKKSAKQKRKTSMETLLISRFLTFVMLGACLLIGATNTFAQTKTVRGRVTTGAGEPISGASVIVKGTKGGTSSSETGQFTIAATKGATLVFSSIGYTAKEIKVGDNNEINVSLAISEKDMGEVVVVGYGTQRKEAITGSVASIGGDKMRDVPSPNISQALQGRLAGVEMSQTSTRPGATMQIRIRGTRSLSADNNPLIVLDGIPFIGSLADINPNDVKSVEVLKDASATAIYGSRGANGVILVTTDKGSKNRKPNINYNSYVGTQSIFAKYPMMNGPQFVALRKASDLHYANGQDESDSLNTDWQDLFYKTGIVTDHNISVSSGTETGNYNFGGGYYLNQGVLPTQQYKRYSFRASVDQQIGKYFRLGFTSNNNYNESKGNQVGLYNTLSMTPISSPYNADGTMKRAIRMILDNQYIYTKDVVENLQKSGRWLNETRGFASYNAVYLEVKAPFLSGLKYRVNLGGDYIQSNGGAYTGQGVGEGAITEAATTTLSTASVDNRYTYHWTLENILSYDQAFAKKHSLNVVALYSAEQNKYNRSYMAAVDMPADAFEFYNLGRANGAITVDPNNQDYQLSGLKSAMGRVMYAYDNRYMLSATLRTDGSSRLAPGHQWNTYPAVSVGWNISNESFMSKFPIINSLKLRAGVGQTSNQAVNPYATLGLLSTRPYNNGSTNSTGLYVTQLPNPDLGWEFSKTSNFGIDFTILKHRLSGTIEYYITNTKNVLLGLSLPQTSGVSGYTANIGSTQNKGFELNLNGTIIDNKNGLTWEAGVNFYTNKNKLVSLASGQTKDEGNWWFVGHNINAIFDYKRIGLYRTAQDSIDSYMNVLEPGGKVGMIKVQYTGTYDVNGKPTRGINGDDRQVYDVDPKWQGGFNTRIAYKGFDLGIVGFYRHGGILFSTINGANGYLNLLSGRRNNINVDYWTPTNTGAKYPRPGAPLIASDNPKYGSTLSYFDGGFMKIRTITLGYDFNRGILKKSGIKLRMYVTAQNPFVFFSEFNKEMGLDPETNSYGNENASVNLSQNLRRILTVGYNTPSTRNYIFGVNLTF